MKHNLSEDLFKLKSPFLQEFIENEMILFTNETAETTEGEKDLQSKRAKVFKCILNATCKHFTTQNQTLSLFNYLYDYLIAKHDLKESGS